jgi:glycosyltransferase involved in cell wall biosynthesis
MTATPQRLSVLAVTSGMPWPLDSGGRLRTFHLLRSLAETFHVRLLVPVARRDAKAEGAMARAGITVLPVNVPARHVIGEARRALQAALVSEPYVLFRRHRWSAMRAALRQEIDRQRPDICYLDHLDSFVYADVCGDRPLVLDLHNVYSELVERTAREDAPRAAGLYLRREARLLARAERAAVSSVRAVLACSSRDVYHFTSLGARAAYLVPNGVDCAHYSMLPTGRHQAPPTILFVGALSWAPNVTAARFLVTEVLPHVRRVIPEAQLRIVGRDPGPEVRALESAGSVEVCANVQDMRPYLRDARVLAVPLLAGGGTRLKILEAFAAGLPVVSTPVGAEGLEVITGRHLWIADRDGFAHAVAQSLRNARQAETLAAHARRLVLDRYDWSAIGRIACQAVADSHMPAPAIVPDRSVTCPGSMVAS